MGPSLDEQTLLRHTLMQVANRLSFRIMDRIHCHMEHATCCLLWLRFRNMYYRGFLGQCDQTIEITDLGACWSCPVHDLFQIEVAYGVKPSL